jgi:hypothetical protein
MKQIYKSQAVAFDFSMFLAMNALVNCAIALGRNRQKQ